MLFRSSEAGFQIPARETALGGDPPPPPLLLQLGRLGLQQVPCEQELAAVQQLGVVHLHRGLRSTATVYIINKQATTSYPYPYCICGRLPVFFSLTSYFSNRSITWCLIFDDKSKSKHHLVIEVRRQVQTTTTTSGTCSSTRQLEH